MLINKSASAAAHTAISLHFRSDDNKKSGKVAIVTRAPRTEITIAKETPDWVGLSEHFQHFNDGHIQNACI